MNVKFGLKHVAQAIVVAAILWAPAVSASATDWGVHNFLEAESTFVSPGHFDSFFAFTMPADGQLNSVAVSNNLLSVLNITGGTVSLYQGDYGNPYAATFITSYMFDGTTGSTDHIITGLLGGYPYYYDVSGFATGSFGGIHVITSTLTLVPEPETYAMMLAGLGLMGFVAYRRKHSHDAAAA